MDLSKPRSFDDELDSASRTYFSYGREDIAFAKRIVAEKVQSGGAASRRDTVDLVNEHRMDGAADGNEIEL